MAAMATNSVLFDRYARPHSTSLVTAGDDTFQVGNSLTDRARCVEPVYNGLKGRDQLYHDASDAWLPSNGISKNATIEGGTEQDNLYVYFQQG